MNPAEIIIILFIVFVLALVGSGHSQSRDEAELAHDVSVVRDVALRYANLECLNPVGAVTLNSATAALGLTNVRVQHPNRWRIALTARPGLTGPATSLQYWTGPDTWQWVYLLDTYPAVARPGHVRLHIHRKPGSPNQRGFQGLVENTLC